MKPAASMILLFIASAVASFLFCFPVIQFLRKRQVLDRPNERSSHVVATPRGGGLAIIGVLIPAFLVLGVLTGERFPLLLAACSVMLAAISFLDDLRPISPAIRFSIHFGAALLLLLGLAFWHDSAPSELIKQRAPSPLIVWFLGVVFCIYLVGYTNAFNFMDGINGLAGAQALVSGAGVAIVAHLVDAADLRNIAFAGAILAGAALGFLPHNFPRARVFMGDVGSVPIGFVSAGLAVVLARKAGLWLIVPLVLLHANYILDTSITLIRRILRGEKWYLPHREHFYQRLVRSGKSHAMVTGTELSLQLVTLAAAIAYLYVGPAARVLLAGAVILMWLAFFAWSELRFRAAQSGVQSIGAALSSTPSA